MSLPLSRRAFIACLAALLFVAPVRAQQSSLADGFAAFKAADYPKAFQIFKRELERGNTNAAAIYALGVMYQKGQGTKVNQVAAVKFFRLAAKAGIIPAQQQMGVHYVKGLGVRKDNIAALMWFSIASANGDNRAELIRQEMELRMATSDVDKALRAASTWMAKNPQAVKR